MSFGKVILSMGIKIVLDFLKLHTDEAFTQDEIIKGVNPNPAAESFIRFLAAMAPLKLNGPVKRREILTPMGPEPC